MANLKKLDSSWTKYDSVKVIQITIDNKLDEYIENRNIDEPVFRNYLGVSSLDDEIPSFWREIYSYPEQIGLFALIAALFTHHQNIDWFANDFNHGNMQGVLIMQKEKHFTNLRSALVVSGASEKIYRRRQEVPYYLSTPFQEGNVGRLTKQLLINRLISVGHTSDEAEQRFVEVCIDYNFHKVFGLTKDEFEMWTAGAGISDALYELEKHGITKEKFGRIRALKTKQWLKDWDGVPRFSEKNRRKPDPFFYQFNIPALLLKRIYG